MRGAIEGCARGSATSSSSGLDARRASASSVSTLRLFFGRSPSLSTRFPDGTISEAACSCSEADAPSLSLPLDSASSDPDSSPSSRFLREVADSALGVLPARTLRFLRLSFLALRYRFFAFVFACAP